MERVSNLALSYRRHSSTYRKDAFCPITTHFSTKQKGRPATGRPFSMGGSPNGGKAIGTLWCKSMVASECCQGAIRTILKQRKFNNLQEFSRFRPAFVLLSSGSLPQTVLLLETALEVILSSLETPLALHSVTLDAGSEILALLPPVCPAVSADQPSQTPGSAPA